MAYDATKLKDWQIQQIREGGFTFTEVDYFILSGGIKYHYILI